jgi:hypothetical protein
MWSKHSRRIEPFDNAVLPGRGWCGRSVPDAHGAQSARDNAAIDPIPIANEVARSLVPGKCLRDLMRNPFGRRMCSDVDPDEVSAVAPDDDESIEQVETDSWNNEQVHGGNVRRVVTQEGSPSLAGWPPSFDHVLGDARLRDLKPELEQFAVNAWRAPKRIFDCAYRKLEPDILVVQPAENGRQRMCPASSTARETGASFSRDRCVRAPL